jgi:hypothetical protein
MQPSNNKATYVIRAIIPPLLCYASLLRVRCAFPGTNDNPLSPQRSFSFHYLCLALLQWHKRLSSLPFILLRFLPLYFSTTIMFGPFFPVLLSYYWEQFSLSLLIPPSLRKWRLKWIGSPARDALALIC